MNTIDMGDYEFTGTPGVGWFNLDGTLTDTSDMCNQIDLGVETPKCYGILNLKVNDTKLSSNGTSNGSKNNNINWSNIYFIGGQFTAGSYLRSNYYDINDSRWLGNALNNVHISMDLVYNVRPGTNYNSGSTASKTATLCTFSGNLILNADNGGNIYPLTYTANRCITYANIVLKIDNGNLTGLAFEAYDCVFRGTTEKLAEYKRDTFITSIAGIATKGQRLKADGVYDFSSDTTFPIYLFTNYSSSDTLYCLFSGTYKVKHTLGTAVYLSYACKYMACTPDSILDGNIGFVNTNRCSDMIFLGTIDLYLVSGVYYMFSTYAYNLLSLGIINIHRNPDDAQFSNVAASDHLINAGITKYYTKSVDIVLMGVDANSNVNTNAIFASDVNFNNDMQGCCFYNTSICLYRNGVGNMTNYSNFELDGNISIKTLNLFMLWDRATVINYGNINCRGHSEFRNINIVNTSGNAGILRNFGDVSLEWTYGTSTYCLNAGSVSSNITDIINYGNISINAIDNTGGICNAAALKNCKYGINYGDVTVDYHGYSDIYAEDKTLAGVLGGGINLGDVSICNMVNIDISRSISVYGAGNENYGKLTVDNLSSTKSFNINIIPIYATLNNTSYSYDYIYNRISKCAVEVKNCDLSNVSVYYYDLYRQSKISGTEDEILDTNLSIKDSTFKNLYLLQGITHKTYSTTTIQTLYNNSFHVGNTGGIITNVENIGTTVVDNVVVNTTCTYSGVVGSYDYNETGYKHNNSTLLFKDCELKDFNYAGISALGKCSANCAEWVNNNNFTMDNVVLKSTAYIDGIVSNKGSNISSATNKVEKLSVSNAYNFATMNIDVSGYPIYISGISRSEERRVGKEC